MATHGGATRKCPKGMIYRRAYTRKATAKRRGSFIHGSCIRDLGAPGKGYRFGGPGIGKLREGELERFGYTGVTGMKAEARHAALQKAVQYYGALRVFRKLHAVYVYTRTTAPSSSAIFKADRDWVRAHFL